MVHLVRHRPKSIMFLDPEDIVHHWVCIHMFATLIYRIKFDSTYNRAFGCHCSLRQYDAISKWRWRLKLMWIKVTNMWIVIYNQDRWVYIVLYTESVFSISTTCLPLHSLLWTHYRLVFHWNLWSNTICCSTAPSAYRERYRFVSCFQWVHYASTLPLLQPPPWSLSSPNEQRREIIWPLNQPSLSLPEPSKERQKCLQGNHLPCRLICLHGNGTADTGSMGAAGRVKAR